jgi:hypothetical protein
MRAAVVLLLALGAWPGAGAGAAAAQTTDLRFPTLLADPREPAFFATYLWTRSPQLGSRLGAVGLGRTIPLVRTASWEVAIAAGVFSQFSMVSATNDLINTDYRVGLPFTYRRRGFATRFQLYHQSSHLGDEYLLHTGAQRSNLTFESAELLLAHEAVRWRAYGGGEYAFQHSPADLKPAALRAGLEYRGAHAVVRVGRFATGRVVAGLDVASAQVRAWQPGWSLVGGLEMSTPGALPGSTWRWRLLFKAYTGPTPYGQFYRDRLSSFGIGIVFAG